MRKSNWIVAAIAAVACGALLWAWFALGFNHVDDSLSSSHATAALPSARPCFPHLPYSRQRRGACLRSATGAPLRLRRGRRGERIGTFPRHFRGRDQVGWVLLH